MAEHQRSHLTVSASPRARVMTFLKEFEAAPNDADLELRIGQMETGAPAVVISINESKHGFTAKEARTVAEIAEDTMKAFPNDPRNGELPNLILMLRHGAAQAEAALTTGGRRNG